MTCSSQALSSRETADLLALLEEHMLREKGLVERLKVAEDAREDSRNKASAREAVLLQNMQLMKREQVAVQNLVGRLKVKHKGLVKKLQSENMRAQEAIKSFQEALHLQKVSLGRLQREKSSLLRSGRKERALAQDTLADLRRRLERSESEARRKGEALERRSFKQKKVSHLEGKLRTTQEEKKRLQDSLQREGLKRKQYYTLSEEWRAKATQHKANYLALSAKTKGEHSVQSLPRESSKGQLRVFTRLKDKLQGQEGEVMELKRLVTLLQREKRNLSQTCNQLNTELQLARKELSLERDIREQPVGSEKETLLEANRRLLKENRALKRKNHDAFRIINTELRKELHDLLTTSRFRN